VVNGSWLVLAPSATVVAASADRASALSIVLVTASGRADVRATGKALKREGVRPDAVWCSPLVRAVQTAELLASELGFGGEVEAFACLEPHGSLGSLLEILGERPELDVVVIAGHEPFLSGAASLLLGLRVSGFPTSGSFHIDLARLEPDAGKLLWRWVHGAMVR